MSGIKMLDDASTLVDAIGEAADSVCNAVCAESAARAERDDFLEALINSIIGQPNELTMKPHSATSAEKSAKTTDEYKAREATLQSAECARIRAWAKLESTKLTAKLAVVAVAGAV
jgi:hypothetical protein